MGRGDEGPSSERSLTSACMPWGSWLARADLKGTELPATVDVGSAALWGCAFVVRSCHRCECAEAWASLALWHVGVERACLHICVPDERAGLFFNVGSHGCACEHTSGCSRACVHVFFQPQGCEWPWLCAKALRSWHFLGVQKRGWRECPHQGRGERSWASAGPLLSSSGVPQGTAAQSPFVRGPASS